MTFGLCKVDSSLISVWEIGLIVWYYRNSYNASLQEETPVNFLLMNSYRGMITFIWTFYDCEIQGCYFHFISCTGISRYINFYYAKNILKIIAKDSPSRSVCFLSYLCSFFLSVLFNLDDGLDDCMVLDNELFVLKL